MILFQTFSKGEGAIGATGATAKITTLSGFDIGLLKQDLFIYLFHLYDYQDVVLNI